MDPATYWYVCLGSLLGGIPGALIAWSRKHGSSPTELRRSHRLFIVVAGTGAMGGAVFAFARAFGVDSLPNAPLTIILLTAWVATLGAAVHLPVPPVLMEVRPGELRVLQLPWTGVPAFGTLLRRTPLRHLGGPVFLANTQHNPRTALAGLRAAERLHLWAMAVSLPWLLFWLARGKWLSMACACAVHLPLNLLPILHLRLAIARTERYRRRWERHR